MQIVRTEELFADCDNRSQAVSRIQISGKIVKCPCVVLRMMSHKRYECLLCGDQFHVTRKREKV
jgi:hypothetical protein